MLARQLQEAGPGGTQPTSQLFVKVGQNRVHLQSLAVRERPWSRVRPSTSTSCRCPHTSWQWVACCPDSSPSPSTELAAAVERCTVTDQCNCHAHLCRGWPAAGGRSTCPHTPPTPWHCSPPHWPASAGSWAPPPAARGTLPRAHLPTVINIMCLLIYCNTVMGTDLVTEDTPRP